MEDSGYKPINPKDIRLPPPIPPTERLLAAIDAFYAPPSHERPRDPEGKTHLNFSPSLTTHLNLPPSLTIFKNIDVVRDPLFPKYFSF